MHYFNWINYDFNPGHQVLLNIIIVICIMIPRTAFYSLQLQNIVPFSVFLCEFCANAYIYFIYVYMVFIEGRKVESLLVNCVTLSKYCINKINFPLLLFRLQV